MAKTTVLADVVSFMNNVGDPVSSSNYYDEVVNDLGRKPWLTNLKLIQAVQGTGTYSLPSTAIDLKGLVYGTQWLTRSELRQLETVNRDWRDVVGDPATYTLEESEKETFAVYPKPRWSGDTLVGNDNFSWAYPNGDFVAFITEFRSTIPAYLNWAVGFQVISREFMRSSDHTDGDGGELAAKISDLLFAMVA